MSTIGDLIYQLDNINSTATVLGLVDLNKTEVNIPATVQLIVTKPYIVKSIGRNAFYNGKNNIKLKTVTFDTTSQLETIGENAFYGTLINNIVLPKTVKTIGTSAFYESKLKNIKFEGDKPNIGEDAFSNIGRFIPAFGDVYENTYDKWREVDMIDDLYINKNMYTNKILLRVLSLLPLLILLLINSYYFLISHSLLTNMLVILPLTLLIIVLIPLGMISKNEDMYVLGGGVSTSILSFSLIIGTLVKSNWSLLYRLPMSILLLASTVGGWVGLFL
jgi:hypothetical protein